MTAITTGPLRGWTSINSKRRSPSTWAIVRTALLIGSGLVAVVPILWTGISSFKTLPQLLGHPLSLPKSLNFANYSAGFSQFDFITYLRNSLIVTVAATLLTLALSSAAGYALAKYNFRGRNFLFIVILATIMIPIQIVLIPIYQVVIDLHLVNSLLGLIIPPAATPTGVFLMRQYFLSIPDELIEAARMDGAGEFRIFLRVILPNAKPALIVLAIISVGWRWNDFIWPLIIAQRPSVYTLPVALGLLSSEQSVPYNVVIAMVFASMVPVLIMYLFLQRHIVRGIAMTGLK
ncbi:MAG: ABC transporter permease subunit [Gallionella sp.]|nr:ABC transporter permease subunit [Gallionella sp.]